LLPTSTISDVTVASSEQIKALIKSHISRDDGHFLSVAMQVAAHEAKLGHGKLAEELREMIDAAKSRMMCEPILMNKKAANKSMWNLSVKYATSDHDLRQVAVVVATIEVVVKE
jgi:hypothetical protein